MTVILKNHKNGKEREFDDKAEAAETRSELIGIGAKPGDLEIIENGGGNASDSEARENGENQSEQNTGESTNGAKEATVVTESEPDEYTEQLPDDGPSVDEDPLVWMPDEFTDTIKGTTAINRKGFEVLAHHYDIECDTEHVVLPSETEYEYAVVKATAVDADGDTYGAYGEADISEEDMERPELLRYADTRAYKRSISRATGVGMVAVSELQAKERL